MNVNPKFDIGGSNSNCTCFIFYFFFPLGDPLLDSLLVGPLQIVLLSSWNVFHLDDGPNTNHGGTEKNPDGP